MEFKYGDVKYRIGDLYGMPEKGRGHVNKHMLFKNEKPLGLFEIHELIQKFKIKIKY